MNGAIKASIFHAVLKFYRTLFLRKSFYTINKMLFDMSLRGMGILNYENDKVGGEEFFLRRMKNLLENEIVFDVGANVGDYSNLVKKLSPNSNIYAFEPHPKTFKKLEVQSIENKYTSINAACSDFEGNLQLFDYGGEQNGSPHASLYQDVINNVHQGKSEAFNVDVTTIDKVIQEYKISRIRLLKIDTEGNELKVLLGAKQAIKDKIVDVIQFEFNEMNTISKVFMKDFYDLLPGYLLYRLLPDGFILLSGNKAVYSEIFAYQNIIAIRKEFTSELGKI